MKYIYTENPLAIQIILDDHEKKILRLKLEIEDLEAAIVMTRIYLDNGKEYYNVEKACQNINETKLYTPERDKILDDLTNDYIKALSEPHAGDCCSLPCTCSKCYASERLDIDELGCSTGNYNTKIGYIILNAFGKVKTCTEAIEYLKNNPPTSTWSQSYHDNYQKAIDYLIKYNHILKISKEE